MASAVSKSLTSTYGTLCQLTIGALHAHVIRIAMLTEVVMDLPTSNEATATLPISAGVAFEIFSDPIETMRWLPFIHTAQIIERNLDGRAGLVEFASRVDRGSLGYAVRYNYTPAEYAVEWRVEPPASFVFFGDAKFLPLSSRACLMLYRVDVDTTIASPSLTGHVASHIAGAFREHIRRMTS